MKLIPINRSEHRGTPSVMGIVDEHASLVDMERAMPVFFRKKHGLRETYTVHRGQLIVRNTPRFSGRPVRMTAIYLFFVDGDLKNDCMHVETLQCSVKQAERIIDNILDKTRTI